MDLSTKHKQVAENLYEVVISVTLTVSVEEMTAYIVEYEMAQGNITPDDEVLVSVEAWRTGGSKMFIKE